MLIYSHTRGQYVHSADMLRSDSCIVFMIVIIILVQTVSTVTSVLIALPTTSIVETVGKLLVSQVFGAV